MAPIDYYGQPIHVGDVCVIVAVDPKGGTPLYATGIPLAVVGVHRTRVEVTGPTFNGTIRPSAEFVAVKS